VRRRPITNGNGAGHTPASGLPLNGGGGPLSGGPVGGSGLGMGQGPSGPGASFGGPAGPPGNLPVPVTQVRRAVDSNGASPGSGAAAGGDARKGGRMALSNWRVRWRLFAIITVPTVTALILGVIQNVNANANYNNFARSQELAKLGGWASTAVFALENERDDNAGYIAQGRNDSALAGQVTADQGVADKTLNQIKSEAPVVVNNGAYQSQVQLDLGNAVQGISDLQQVRIAARNQTAGGTLYPASPTILTYDRIISQLVTFVGDVASGSGNVTLENQVSTLATLLRVSDDASLERAYLYQALTKPTPQLTPGELDGLNNTVAKKLADLAAFTSGATVTEFQFFQNTVSGQAVDEAESALRLAITSATAGGVPKIGSAKQLQSCVGPNSPAASPAGCWRTIKSVQLKNIKSVADSQVGQIQDQAGSLASKAQRSFILISIATIILLALVLLITTVVARSMIRPLRRLRSDALDIANSKLPEMVRRLSESEGGDENVEIEPVGVTSTDEIGEVARAFDQVHREAVRLAADEAMLRGNLNAMFVNLSRRSQSLIERQLTLIDNLEQSEQDADRLSSLFRLDHLATRMRRNSENLLVLAGHEGASRRWTQPVPLVDVLRAAISEIEQYERVVLNVQPGIQVVGQAVNDIVHLVAEIVENATTFSPEDTQVYVTGQPLNSGGVLLDITDNGVGISEQEMAHANWRLDNPPVVDVAVSRRMGLFVVGRLAARHGVRVRLRHAQSGGLTALIWLPESVAAPEAAAPLGRLRKFESDDHGPAPSLSAPTGGFGSGSGGASSSVFGGPGAPGPGFGGSGGGFGGQGTGGGFGSPGGPGAGNAAAAAASRIPRLAPGNNGGNGSGGAFGGGAFGGGSGFGDDSTFGGSGLPTRGGSGSGFGSHDESAAGGNGLPTRQPGTQLPGNGSGSRLGIGAGTPGGGPAFGGTGNDFGSDSDFGGAGDFPTSRRPVFDEPPAGLNGLSGGVGPGSTGPVPVLGGPGSTGPFPTLGGSGTSGPSPVAGFGGGSDGSQVTIPPSVSPAQDQRLPIFDSLESDWFRRSGKSLSQSSTTASGTVSPGDSGGWNSPADEGWRAAQVVASPTAEETTTAGLPKRVPRANLVPGSVGGGEGTPEAAPPARSADDIRNRMASFQRGVRDARAAAPQNEEP
jgi:signal transduction histidine kinase